jgi:hypothetical protein
MTANGVDCVRDEPVPKTAVTLSASCVLAWAIALSTFVDLPSTDCEISDGFAQLLARG